MNAVKLSVVLLLILALTLSCLPLGAITAFAAEIGEDQILPSEPSDPNALAEIDATEVAIGVSGNDSISAPTETTTPSEELPTEDNPSEIIPTETNPLMFSVSPLADGGSSGSETGDAGSGGNEAGEGNSNMVAAGVTMQVVYYRYDQCYNRYNSHGSVINTLKTGNAVPWNSTGKDTGDIASTVFDTYTISSNTFIIKGGYDAWPYVYHFPTENLKTNKCNFTWTGWQNFWFNYDNPGGKASTYPRIVRNEENGSLAIERYIRRIILGNDYGEWDKLDVAKGETVETDT